MSEDQVFAFVFDQTGITPGRWAAADHDEKLELLAEALGPKASAQQEVIRLAVVEQLLSGEVPGAEAAFRRARAAGLPVPRALDQLSMAFTATLVEALDGGTFDADLLDRRFALVPLPEAGVIEHALCSAAVDAVVLGANDLTTRALEWLVLPEDDFLVDLVDRVQEELVGDFGPLTWLSGDRVVSVEALCRPIVLTHVLSDVERELDALTVSFDLAGFGWIDEPTFDGQALDPMSLEPGQLSWHGPRGWLQRFDVGAALAVRLDGVGTTVRIEVLDRVPDVDPALVARLRRAYEDEVAEPQLPVSGTDLLLGILVEDRHAFDQPQAPLADLCAAAGLERRASAVAHDASMWANLGRGRQVGRVFDAADGDRDLAEAALGVLDVLVELTAGSEVAAGAVEDALDWLGDLELLEIVTDELFDPDLDPEPMGPGIGRLLAAARRGGHRAAARFLAALDAEHAGDWAAAEQHLELAVEADGGFVPALDRLAWYASDRGNAPRALRLWQRCGPSRRLAQDLATLEEFARAERAMGRNEPCWCGSGRKYKQCHLDVPAHAPLPDRVGWLCRKAVNYLERIGPEPRSLVTELIWARAGEQEAFDEAADDPLVMDVVLTEGGWFAQFLADRGALLPDDEALLAASWLTVDRSVHEVTAVHPGIGLSLRDLRTGEEREVRERTFSRTVRTGERICARAVPDGDSHQLIGSIFPVAPGHETPLLDLLDRGDPIEIVDWAAALHAPPQLRTRENEPVVACEITVETGDRRALTRHLDRHYQVDEPGAAWSEHHDLDDLETVVRATFHLDGERLTISTNSNERADRILDRLDEIDAVVTSDQRAPVDPAELRSARDALPDLSRLTTGPAAEVPAGALEEILTQMEDRWCSESVPALDGLTPREAAADPTRRESLERLLRSFEDRATPPDVMTFRTDRLRQLLGLDGHPS